MVISPVNSILYPPKAEMCAEKKKKFQTQVFHPDPNTYLVNHHSSHMYICLYHTLMLIYVSLILTMKLWKLGTYVVSQIFHVDFLL